MTQVRQIRLVAFDMDGTLVDTVSSWVFVHHHFGENNDEALRAFMHDEINDQEFIRRDLSLWHRHIPELSATDVAKILKDVPLMPGAHELMKALKARGMKTVIVSGGLDLLAQRIKEELGMDLALANVLETDRKGTIVGGKVVVPVKRKEEVLRKLQGKLGVAPEETASVGNSEIDVGLFRASRIRVAFCPQDEYVISNATSVITERDLREVLLALEE
jgi:phosphoserine phosphatase